jgi:hypothetical protein
MKGSGREAALGESASDGADARVDVPFTHVTLKPPILLSLSTVTANVPLQRVFNLDHFPSYPSVIAGKEVRRSSHSTHALAPSSYVRPWVLDPSGCPFIWPHLSLRLRQPSSVPRFASLCQCFALFLSR